MVACKDSRIRETVIRLINANEQWNGMGAASVAEAITIYSSQPVNLVLIGGGLSAAEEQELTAAINSAIPVIKHYGGGSGLLTGEIYQAIGV